MDGVPRGWLWQDKNYYIINHLKFKVLVHEYEDSGFNSLIGAGDEGMGAVATEDNAKKKSGFEVVGFEVVPCIVKWDPAMMSKFNIPDKIPPVECGQEMQQVIKEHEQISFTYEVVFEKSEIRWPSKPPNWSSALTKGKQFSFSFKIVKF